MKTDLKEILYEEYIVKTGESEWHTKAKRNLHFK
jgi:hypothetical protein